MRLDLRILSRIGLMQWSIAVTRRGGALSLAALALAAGLYFSRAQTAQNPAAVAPPQVQPVRNNPPAAIPPQQKIANQSAVLLKMASDLKTAVDRSNKDTLSVTVVRKANEIEQFARMVRTGVGKK